MALDPVGRCIYCGAITYSPNEPARKLGDEHIIPQSIGGILVLPEASCADCERKTSRIETDCVRCLFDSGRMHLGLRGRRQKKQRKTVLTRTGAQRVRLPIYNHPGAIMGFHFDFPAAFLGLDPQRDITAQVTFTTVVPDFKERVRRLGPHGLHVNLGGGISAETYARFLAKIAHAFATACFGVNGFVPWLLPSIIGQPPYTGLIRYVGTTDLIEPKSQQRHDLSFSVREDIRGTKLIVVHIRLFGDLGVPTHYVIAGMPLSRAVGLDIEESA